MAVSFSIIKSQQPEATCVWKKGTEKFFAIPVSNLHEPQKV